MVSTLARTGAFLICKSCKHRMRQLKIQLQTLTPYADTATRKSIGSGIGGQLGKMRTRVLRIVRV